LIIVPILGEGVMKYYIIYSEREENPFKVNFCPIPKVKISSEEDILREAEEDLQKVGYWLGLSNFMYNDKSLSQEERILALAATFLQQKRLFYLIYKTTEEGASEFLDAAKKYGLEREAKDLIEKFNSSEGEQRKGDA